jgi:hypothetical protein
MDLSRRVRSAPWVFALAVACTASACMDLDGYQLLVADAGDAGGEAAADASGEAAADASGEAAADASGEVAVDASGEAAADASGEVAVDGGRDADGD